MSIRCPICDGYEWSSISSITDFCPICDSLKEQIEQELIKKDEAQKAKNLNSQPNNILAQQIQNQENKQKEETTNQAENKIETKESQTSQVLEHLAPPKYYLIPYNLEKKQIEKIPVYEDTVFIGRVGVDLYEIDISLALKKHYQSQGLNEEEVAKKLAGINTISKEHGQISCQNGQYYYVHLSDTSSTRLTNPGDNTTDCKTHQPVLLKDKARLILGNYMCLCFKLA